MDVHPTKNVSIGIDPYPYQIHKTWGGSSPKLINHCLNLRISRGWTSAGFLEAKILVRRDPDKEKKDPEDSDQLGNSSDGWVTHGTLYIIILLLWRFLKWWDPQKMDGFFLIIYNMIMEHPIFPWMVVPLIFGTPPYWDDQGNLFPHGKCHDTRIFVAGWWFGTFLFFHILGIIIPND